MNIFEKTNPYIIAEMANSHEGNFEIAKKIIDNGGDYVLALKNNQKSFYERVEAAFNYAIECNFEEHGSLGEGACGLVTSTEGVSDQFAVVTGTDHTHNLGKTM